MSASSVNELLTLFTEGKYGIEKGNIIVIGADFAPPDFWNKLIRIFMARGDCRTLTFDVLSNQEMGDWKSSLDYHHGYRYFFYSKAFIIEMLSKLGLRKENFKIIPSDKVTSPRGYSFRTWLVTIKKQ